LAEWSAEFEQSGSEFEHWSILFATCCVRHWQHSPVCFDSVSTLSTKHAKQGQHPLSALRSFNANTFFWEGGVNGLCVRWTKAQQSPSSGRKSEIVTALPARPRMKST
jgi:hypothetical protein